MINAAKLSVLSVGYLVDIPARGTQSFQVHSCFEHALNLTQTDGNLLTLLSQHYQNLPMAIRLNTPTGWNWRHHSARGQSVVVHNACLFGDSWSVDLSDTVCWQPERLCIDANDPGLVQMLSYYPVLAGELLSYCQLNQVSSCLQLMPECPVGGRVPVLNLTDDRQRLEDQVSQLIGFGHGLTPDGDDYLVGYLAALWPWLHLTEVASHLRRLDESICIRLDKTTDISRHYLTLALQGHYSEPINRLLASLFNRASEDEVSFSVRQVMQFGASSGVDCMAGLLHGLRSLKSIS